MLKGYFYSNNDDCNKEHISEKVLLPVGLEECKIWLEHLKAIVENHKRGAKKFKAAEVKESWCARHLCRSSNSYGLHVIFTMHGITCHVKV